VHDDSGAPCARRVPRTWLIRAARACTRLERSFRRA
jgi:hypothetical protein